MRRSIPLIVFSDLDGTLLDHDSYSWAPAQPALLRLASLHVPLILATSKTEAEVRPLQQEIGLSGYPAIVENGAGVIGMPKSKEYREQEYDQLRSCLGQTSKRLRSCFTGFGDMSTEQVSSITGLSLTQARNAKKRAFSEPGHWSGTCDECEEFIAELAVFGISARAGGRFLTLSFGKTKENGMAEIASHFGAEKTLALGDAPNDVEMLEAADIAFVIANPHRAPLPVLQGEKAGHIRRSEDAGPAGWNAAINTYLDTQGWTSKDKEFG